MPMSQTPYYTVRCEHFPEDLAVEPENLCHPEATAGVSEDNIGIPMAPSWLHQGCRVKFMYGGSMWKGTFELDKDNDWEFVRRDRTGQKVVRYPVPDLIYSWRQRLLEQMLKVGWEDDPSEETAQARHVSAAKLERSCPNDLKEALSDGNPDKGVWRQSYDEEYDGLSGQNTYKIIGEEKYQELVKEKGIQAIPSMCVLTIKKNEDGNPIRSKSRIVVLGNLEQRVWEKKDKYAPVIGQASTRLLVSLAVKKGRSLKQGDCKNAFCHSTLPEDEVVVVRPPQGCPRSKRGEYWLLNKTLYGLSCSPRHWFESFTSVLKDLGLRACEHEPCLYTGTPIDGQLPVYVRFYVDDFVYFSESDQVERKLEEGIQKALKVEFMGEVSWFLGCRYKWERINGELSYTSHNGHTWKNCWGNLG